MKKHKGVEYIVYWYKEIGHFNGYVRIPDEHPYNKMVDKVEETIFGTLNNGYDDIHISCHGGLTFSRRVKKGDDFLQQFSPGAWIGWDYAHAGDKISWPESMRLSFTEKGKEWSKEEVERECKNVINQLLKVKGNEKLSKTKQEKK